MVNEYKLVIDNNEVFLSDSFFNRYYINNIRLNINNSRYIISKEECDFIRKTKDRDILYLYLMKIINRNGDSRS
jgi:hypothetical protein